MPTSDAEQIQHIGPDGSVLSLVSRAQMRAENLCHRAVFVVVLSGDGCLLVHRRSASKDLWPGWWDIAVGGVVVGDENYEDAARRELDEEIGLHDIALEYLCDGAYRDDSVHLVGRCFRVRSNGPFIYRDGEVEETRLVTPSQLTQMTNEYKFLPDSMALVLPHLEAFRVTSAYDGGQLL